MSGRKLDTGDYPLAEQRPDLVRSHGGRSLDDLTMDAVMDGDVTLEDLRITPDALRMQAEIARAAGRATLAANFERAAEMTALPQATVMQVYEKLRPGRAASKQELLDIAAALRDDYGAVLLAAMVEEAADVYERRGLFRFRF